MDRKPLAVAPYDAELFGHWWFEGPRWLDHLIRKSAGRTDSIRLITLSEYLREYPMNQTATPCMSSWGYGGFSEVWLNAKNDWIYPHIHSAGWMMEDLSARDATPGSVSRAVNQAARELLLAQASDWAFMINSGNMGDYPNRRIKSHLERFHRLKEQIENDDVDVRWLEGIEKQDNIFSAIPLQPAAAFRTYGGGPHTTVETGTGKIESIAEPLHIVMICPEIVPFAKTGGLADMAGSLAIALGQLGHRVSLMMPAYRHALRSRVPMQQTGIRFPVPVDGRSEEAELLTARLSRAVPVYLIRADRYFDRDYLYGTSEGDYLDNVRRFAFFNRAALELIGKIGIPDVLHAHDWQAALSIAFLKNQPERYPGLASIGTVLTVHNLGYQGLSGPENWHFLGLDRSLFNIEGLEFYGKINLLKAGLVFADTITTVSATYAREIRTRDYGFGLDGVLQRRAKDVVGILNGVDYGVWNPSTDSFLAQKFSPDDLAGKQACKADLQRIFGLPENPQIPLLAIVSRLASQKGVDLVEGVLDQLLQRDLQFVLLGAGDKHYQHCFEAAARRHPERIGVRIGFDEALAHKIEGGADIFLMPSRYEPSGLNQLYSLKYGTIPVVRATGGLKDSVQEFDPARLTGTGFLFEAYDGRSFLYAIDRALAVFGRKADWTKLMKNAMSQDYSWGRSAREYVEVYKRLRKR
jgi:starch synthase